MEVHRLADTTPDMTDNEFDDLVESIQIRGLLIPIVTFEGKILDGRHRFKACTKTGVSPRFEEYTGTEPASHILALNCRRDHTPAQRALMAAALLPDLEKEAATRSKANLKQGGSKPDPATTVGAGRHASESTTKAAKAVGVGRGSVQTAKKIVTAAASGSKPALKAVADIKSGKTTTISRAASQAGLTTKKIKEQFPKADQKKANGERPTNTIAIDSVSLLLQVDSVRDKIKEQALGLLTLFAGTDTDQEIRNLAAVALDEAAETLQTVKLIIVSKLDFDDLLK